MTSQHTTIYTPFADGRPVRDFVEHTPALVDETWCRDLLRHALDALEQQYATGAPHRSITPDTLVMLENGEALLMPSPGEAPSTAPGLPADLHALALVVHYAITAELPPDGPLGPRLYDNYSEQLTKGLDCCLGPNRRLRPQTVNDMRRLLGIEATAEALEPTPPAPLAVVKPAVPLDAAPVREDSGARAEAAIDQYAAPPLVETPAGPDVVSAASALPTGENPAPEPVLTTPAAPAPSEEAAEPLSTAPEPLSLRERTESGMLRKPASEDARTAEAARAAPPVSALHESTRPAPAASFKPSAAIPPGAPGTRRGASTQPPANEGRSSRAQRWGMLAGAAIVVLAAGGAIVSYLQQNDGRELVPLSLPPAGRAATGLAAGETVVAPPAEAAATDGPMAAHTDQPMAAQPADGPLDATTGAPPDAGAGLAGAAPQPATPAAGTASATIINGTTYKLVIKPWGTLYVNGVDHGVSPPVKRLTLGPGRHTIQIVNPNFPEHTITVDAGTRESAVIKHDFRAQAR